VTFGTSDLAALADDDTQAKGFHMSAHFTATDSLTNEAPSFSPARNGNGTLAVWGLVLGSLLLGVTTVAAVTATAWLNGAVIS
jgi:hypothetical protein